MKYFAFDFEASAIPNHMPYNPKAYPVCLCIITQTGKQYEWVFNHNEQPDIRPFDDVKQEIQELFDSVDLIIAHNIKYDIHWLRRLGIDFSKNRLYCTQVAEYLINGENNRILYSLAETSKRYGIPDKHDVVKDWWKSGYDTCDVPLHILIPYCFQDTANTLAIYQQQRSIIQEKGLDKLVRLSCELSRICADIEWNGMVVDIPLCHKYSDDYGQQIEKLYAGLCSFVRLNIPDLECLPECDTKGKSLPNFGSGDQLSAILFGGNFTYNGRVAGARDGTTKNGKVTIVTKGLGLQPREGTETSKEGYYQTDIAQLTGLKVKNKIQKVFLEQLGELSKLEKMKGTYFDGMIKHEIASVVHCNIHQTRTVTGRFSATEPALQTIPRGSTSSVKEVFISRYD